MVQFKCVLTAEAVSRLYGALSCLAKFDEVVGLDITQNQLSLIALNPTKTGSVCMVLSGEVFFQSFSFVDDDYGSNQFRCQLYNRSLQSVFKTKASGPKDDDSVVSSCEITIQDSPDKIECRLIISMTAQSGVRKTHKLTYEASDVPRAAFSRTTARSRWTMSAYMLKSFTEYFGAKTELLDIYSENGRISFTSYTEKVMRGSEVLKQPLQTTIDVDTLDFSDFQVEERVHVGISVKDFRAIVAHADSLHTAISAHYSLPRRPMQLFYEDHGLACEFIVATTGSRKDISNMTASNASRTASAAIPPPSTAGSRGMIPGALEEGRQSAPNRSAPGSQSSRRTSEMRPPSASRPLSVRTHNTSSSTRMVRPPAITPSASVDEQSLFLNDDDDEGRWDEANYDKEDDQLGWNDSYASEQLKQLTQSSVLPSKRPRSVSEHEENEIPPTQPMNNMRGLFD